MSVPKVVIFAIFEFIYSNRCETVTSFTASEFSFRSENWHENKEVLNSFAMI